MTDINEVESANESSEWEVVQPAVNAEAEFYEILNDFGNPLEILREAISNSIDAQATWVQISFDVEEIEGNNRLIIVLSDNGYGMSREVLKRDFWGLGHSPSRGQKDNPRTRTASRQGRHAPGCELRPRRPRR
ncbi:MAG TPA: ATP-binding protein, partial [Rubrobacteraceae bacterium]|nr:ATP-binding protein [Rubrobacteraceae bacterium]